eukprot:TRINITY_DN14724_c0_g5_i3.p1 TRINITY_DN14724_c0_g5~~TRINITY_DN14724_c0_g5_i3.p1  ORF type:complete len:179 (+),score=43.61 TRINITY_DN14724_c0_g5_i3:184-720(+)
MPQSARGNIKKAPTTAYPLTGKIERDNVRRQIFTIMAETAQTLSEQERADLTVRLEEALNEDAGNEPREYRKQVMKVLNAIKKKGQSLVEELRAVEGKLNIREVGSKEAVSAAVKSPFTKVPVVKPPAPTLPQTAKSNETTLNQIIKEKTKVTDPSSKEVGHVEELSLIHISEPTRPY